MLVFLVGIAAVVVLVRVLLGNEALVATKRGGQQPAEPFRIAGNFYYVGANDISAFLITGPEGHVVLDAGYPTTAPMIMASMAKLGFDIKDVTVLLNSEPHSDHAGGLAVLQRRPQRISRREAPLPDRTGKRGTRVPWFGLATVRFTNLSCYASHERNNLFQLAQLRLTSRVSDDAKGLHRPQKVAPPKKVG